MPETPPLFGTTLYQNLVGDHRPDILDCLNNLSNDEVFTPPAVAVQVLDLLPPDVWSDPGLTFLDPACKTGVFLREAAKRLMVGLAGAIPDESERRAHVFGKMLYGLAITELTGLIARRSLYYSKDAASEFSVLRMKDPQGNVHYSRGTHVYGANHKCKVCGAPEGALDRGEALENYAYQFIHTKDLKDIFPMKFDVIIGNPPYQLQDAGESTGASPIYQLFVEQAIRLNPSYLAMIIPARWYASGKGLDDFRNQMINDRRIKYLVDYPKLFECFPGVEIKGGVCYFLWEAKYSGDCTVRTIIDGEQVSEATRDLREGGDVLVRSNEAMPILKKVQARSETTLEEFVSTQKPFGIRTYEMGTEEVVNSNDLILFRRGGSAYVGRDAVIANHEWVDRYKVLTARAGDGHGRIPMTVIGEPILAPPGSVCSETYLVVNAYEIGGGSEADRRRIGGGSEADRRRIGGGSEADRRRIGGGKPLSLSQDKIRSVLDFSEEKHATGHKREFHIRPEPRHDPNMDRRQALRTLSA